MPSYPDRLRRRPRIPRHDSHIDRPAAQQHRRRNLRLRRPVPVEVPGTKRRLRLSAIRHHLRVRPNPKRSFSSNPPAAIVSAGSIAISRLRRQQSNALPATSQSHSFRPASSLPKCAPPTATQSPLPSPGSSRPPHPRRFRVNNFAASSSGGDASRFTSPFCRKISRDLQHVHPAPGQQRRRKKLRPIAPKHLRALQLNDVLPSRPRPSTSTASGLFSALSSAVRTGPVLCPRHKNASPANSTRVRTRNVSSPDRITAARHRRSAPAWQPPASVAPSTSC